MKLESPQCSAYTPKPTDEVLVSAELPVFEYRKFLVITGQLEQNRNNKDEESPELTAQSLNRHLVLHISK